MYGYSINMQNTDLLLAILVVIIAVASIIRVIYRIKAKKGATLCNGCTIDSKPKIKEFR